MLLFFAVPHKRPSRTRKSERKLKETPITGAKALLDANQTDTEHKLSQQTTEELRFRLDQQSRILDITLSSISDFAYIFDRDGRFVFVNQALLDLWGLQLDDAVGKNFHELKYPQELANRLHSQIKSVFDNQQEIRDETPYTSPTGSGGYYEYIFRPVFDRNGKVELVAGSTRDITKRKRVEEDLKDSRKQLYDLAKSLESLVKVRTEELEERNREIVLRSEQLRNLSVRLMELQDQVSRRIARELHDSAGQTIAAILMNIGRLSSGLKSENSAWADVAEEAKMYAEELNKEIRTTSYLLHPPMLDEIGLLAALEWYVGGLKQRAGIEVILDTPEIFERLSRELELVIFRVVQECLVNVHRHSGSKSAQVKITRDSSMVYIEVRDYGHGIPAEKLARIREEGTGVGVRGMKERIRQFSGHLKVDSQVGVGTTITATLLLRPPAELLDQSAQM